MRRPRVLAGVLLLSVVAIWGVTFVLVKEALADCSPLLFSLLRMVLATAVLCVLNRSDLLRLDRRRLLAGAGVGCFLGLGYQFQTAGLALTTPAKSAFITGMVVVFVPLLSAVPALRGDRGRGPGPAGLAGALLAFVGLVLLTTPAGTSLGGTFSGMGRGDVLTVLCALAFAGHLLAQARVTPRVPVRQLATVQVGAAAMLMAVTLPLGGVPAFHASPRLWVALGVTGILATAFAFSAQSWAQGHLSATETALLLTLEPVFATATSVVLFHERLGAREWTGAALILAGIGVAEWMGATEQSEPATT